VRKQEVRQIMRAHFDKQELEALKSPASKIKEVIKASGF
jgi:hypothetical protein